MVVMCLKCHTIKCQEDLPIASPLSSIAQSAFFRAYCGPHKPLHLGNTR